MCFKIARRPPGVLPCSASCRASGSMTSKTRSTFFSSCARITLVASASATSSMCSVVNTLSTTVPGRICSSLSGATSMRVDSSSRCDVGRMTRSCNCRSAASSSSVVIPIKTTTPYRNSTTIPSRLARNAIGMVARMSLRSRPTVSMRSPTSSARTLIPVWDGGDKTLIVARSRRAELQRAKTCAVSVNDASRQTAGGARPRAKPITAEIRNSRIATKKMIFAISMAVPAIPPKPSTAATSAMIKKVSAQPNIGVLQTCGDLYSAALVRENDKCGKRFPAEQRASSAARRPTSDAEKLSSYKPRLAFEPRRNVLIFAFELHAGGERHRLSKRCEILLQILLRIFLQHCCAKVRLQHFTRSGRHRHRYVHLTAEFESEVEILAQQFRRERCRPVEIDQRRRLVGGEHRAHDAVVEERQKCMAWHTHLVGEQCNLD